MAVTKRIRARPSRDVLLLIGVIVAVTLIALPTLTYPLGRDQGVFAVIGRGILAGKTPYVDLWDPKPPAIYYTYALAIQLFGQKTAAIRAIDLVIFPPIALALFWIGKRIVDARVGLWAALLFGVFYFTETFWTLTQNDGIALLPMVLAVACAIQAADTERRSAWCALAAGALCGCAIWFKYPFVIHVGAVAFAYVWMRVRRRWPDVFAFVLGGLLIGAAGIAYMMLIGAWDALLQSIILTTGYTATSLGDFGEAMRTALGTRWQHWGLLLILVGIALITGVRRFNRRSAWWIAIVWLVAETATMVIQAKAFDYHWLPMLAPLALIGAGGIEAVIRSIPSPRAIFDCPPLSHLRGEGASSMLLIRNMVAFTLLAAMAVAIWSLALPYLSGQEDQIAYYHHFQAGEFVADESQEMADFLRARVAPGDSLFIWGFRPEVYYLSQLNPAVRFISQFPLVSDWYPAAWRERTVEILWAALPPYVLVLQGDYMPWVTGSDEDSNTLLQAYTELNNWLEFNYEQDTKIGNFLIWRRISTPK